MIDIPASDGKAKLMSLSYAWQTDDSIQVKRRRIYGDYARRVSGKNCAWRADICCEKASRNIARGFKCIHAETEEKLNKMIEVWLSEDNAKDART